MVKSGLILGVDPSIKDIPNTYSNIAAWGRDIITTCKDHIVGVKFQSAYFEQHGLTGLTQLVELIHVSKECGLTVIMDAKRGDIGSTALAYAKAYLAKGSEFESDFLTVNPLMGEDCLQPFVDIALDNKKGIFILLETSNSGANMILKKSDLNNRQINEEIANYILKEQSKLSLEINEIGPIGCVIGATNHSAKFWRKKLPNSMFLMPGIGAQGGEWASVKDALNKDGNGVMVPISRGITKPLDNMVSIDNYLIQVKNNVTKFSHSYSNLLQANT